MSMSSQAHSPVAYNYAEAVFNIAKRQGDLPSLVEQAAVLVEVMEYGEGRFRRFLEGPQITTEAKFGLIDTAMEGKIDALFVNLMKLLIDRGRIGLIRDILAVFDEKVAEERGIHPGRVVTAMPLAATQQMALNTALEQFTKVRLNIDFTVDPAIMGGVVFRYKDVLIDSSVKGRFDELRRRLETVRVV